MGKTWSEVVDERPELGRIGKTGDRLIEQAAKEAVRKKIRTASLLNGQNTTPDMLKARWGTGNTAFDENIQKAAADAAKRKKQILYKSGAIAADENNNLESAIKSEPDFKTFSEKGRSMYDIQHTGRIGVDQQEADNYSYLLGKYGKKSANKYLSDIRRRVNARKAEKQNAELEERLRNNKGEAVMYSLLAPIGSGLGLVETGVQAVKNKITGKNEAADPNSSWFGFAQTQRIAENVLNEGKGTAGQLFTQAAISGGQNLAARVATLGNPALALVSMASSAAGRKALENAEKGISAGKSLVNSVTTGAIEYATEKIPFENLNKLVKAPAEGVLKTGVRMLTHAVGDGLGEATADVLNNAGDVAVLGEKSDYLQYQQHLIDNGMSPDEAAKTAAVQFNAINPALSAAVGTLSGGMLGGVAKLTALPISGWNSTDTNVRRDVRYSADESKTAANQSNGFTVLDIEGYPKKGNSINALSAKMNDSIRGEALEKSMSDSADDLTKISSNDTMNMEMQKDSKQPMSIKKVPVEEERKFKELSLETFKNMHHSISKEERKIVYGNGHLSGYINSSNARKINKVIRQDGQLSSYYQKIADVLQAIIDKNPLTDDIMVTRYVSDDALESIVGVKIPKERFKKTKEEFVAQLNDLPNSIQNGHIYTEKAFMSTSGVIGKNVMKDKHILLKIKAPKGTPCYITTNNRESEIIFGQGTKLKILDAKIEGSGTSDWKVVLECIIVQ